MANLLLTIALLCMFVTTAKCTNPPKGKVPAILVFGDSTVDTGNNNYVPTAFKANHSPYGLNLVNHSASGRFSDGRLVPDFLASVLGIKELVPPFLDPKLSDQDVLTGVCFASAGSGYDDLTSATSLAIPVSEQPKMFQKYVDRLKRLVGDQNATKIVNNALIMFSAGTNDFVLNYYIDPVRRIQYKTGAYEDYLLQRLQGFFKEIYDLGGRKFVVAGMAPIGCTPLLRNVFDRSCEEHGNSDAIAYNKKLNVMLEKTQSSLPGSTFVYVDIYDLAWDMMTNPSKYGFQEVKKGCCGTGYVETGPLCTSISQHCAHPSKYMFWDCIHPSEKVYEEVAKMVLKEALPKLY